MSIVTEALKKIQTERSGQIIEGIKDNNRRKLLFLKIYSAVVFVCILILGLAFLYRQGREPVENAAAKIKKITAPSAIEKTLLGRKTPVISGIMYSTSQPQAIINGRIVSEGVVIDGFLVNEILPDAVRGSLAGRELELKLK